MTDTESNALFQVHPTFFIEKFWYDWVLIKLSDDDDVDAVPAKLEMFLDLLRENTLHM